jgi:hypothetical protein
MNLPTEVIENILIYSSFNTICITRELQSEYFKYETAYGNFHSAIRNNNLRNLKWLINYNRIHPNEYEEVYKECINNRNIEALIETHKLTKHPLSADILNQAIISLKNIDIIKRLYELGCPFDCYTFFYSLISLEIKDIKWFIDLGCHIDAETINMVVPYGISADKIALLISLGCEVDTDAMDLAVITNQYVIVNLFLMLGVRMSIATIGHVFKNDRLDMLLLLLNYGYELSPRSFSFAIAYESKKILEWFCSRNCPWNEWNVNEAIEEDNVELLNYFYLQGFKLTAGTFKRAITYDSVKCIEWLVKKKCPFNNRTLDLLLEAGYDELYCEVVARKRPLTSICIL